MTQDEIKHLIATYLPGHQVVDVRSEGESVAGDVDLSSVERVTIVKVVDRLDDWEPPQSVTVAGGIVVTLAHQLSGAAHGA